MGGKLDIRQDGDVLHLRLNRPEVRNALDEELIREVTHALRHEARDPATRVVVLEGEGKVFCAGADLQYMRRLADADQATNLEDARRLGELFSSLGSCPRAVMDCSTPWLSTSSSVRHSFPLLSTMSSTSSRTPTTWSRSPRAGCTFGC